MRRGIAVAALCAACGGGGGGRDGGEPDAPAPTETFAVVVVGAGNGGTSAALAAARHGASVLLVERTGWVGGQMASVPSIEDSRITRGVGTGIVAEVQDALIAHYDGIGLSVESHGAGTISAEPRVVRDLYVQRLADAGVTLRLHTEVVSVQRTDARVTGVTLSDGNVVASQVVIDATELGDVLPLTGAAYRVGNQVSTEAIDPTACVQAITYVAPIRKYAAAPPPGLAIANEPPGYAGAHDWFASMVQAVPGGDITATPWTWARHNLYRAVPDSAGVPYDMTSAQTLASSITRTSVNYANDVPLAGASTLPVAYVEDRAARAATDCAARLVTLQFLYFVQHDLTAEAGERWSVADDGGFDTAGDAASCPDLPAALAPLVAHLPPFPYAREGRRIVAVHTLTGADIWRSATRSATAFHTSIARGGYSMDLHGCNGDADLDAGDAAVPRSDWGTYAPFVVPFESLIPIAVDGLLAAEKNIGVSRLANGATRLQGVTMLTGQAAGVIAALAVAAGAQPREVEPFLVQRALVADGAGVAMDEFADVPTTDARWGAIQLVAVRGVMVGTSPTTFAPDTVLDRAHAAVVLTKVLQLPVESMPTESPFTDVLVTDPYLPYIKAVYDAGLTTGCGGGNFCPTAPLTRAQLAVFLVRGLGATPPACTTAPFADVAAADPTCPFIAYAASTGLVADCGGGNFCPAAAVTRGDIAAPLVATMIAAGAPP